ncbi:GNAT family N-acetyltransferase [Acinetobacter ihumii]|uniref:GNAT family N-acetyltransferase n=1 Tax=Acinetobacter ihumii TaxID=2483802 RepID=UPI001D193F1D|nr:GNAT family N-acetyltransferase [Acinetobacter ihumii]
MHPILKQLLLQADPDWQSITQYVHDSLIFLVQDSEQNILGELCLIADNHLAEIKNLAIAKEYQGLGLAKGLIHYAIDYCQKQDIHTLIVKTGNSSLNQLALYQKCGFRMSYIETDAFKDYPEPIFENGIHCVDQIVLIQQL